MSLITGVSTDTEFLEAINDKGASLTNESTAYDLATAIDATGGNVSWLSPNEVVVEAINGEVPPTQTFDVIFRTFDYSGISALGLGNENIEFNEEYWESTEPGVYTLKDIKNATITLDGIAAEELTYVADPGAFLFDQTVLQTLFAKYGLTLEGCPITINTIGGLIKIGDSLSNPVDLSEVFLTEHLPQWVVDNSGGSDDSGLPDSSGL